jgi:hypothetical protein
MRRRLLLLVVLLAAQGAPLQAAAQAPFQVPEGDRMRVATRGLGWTVLRDVSAPRDAAETGMVLIRAQRPVPPASMARRAAGCSSPRRRSRNGRRWSLR